MRILKRDMQIIHMVSCIASLQDSECVKLGLIILNDFYGGLLK